MFLRNAYNPFHQVDIKRPYQQTFSSSSYRNLRIQAVCFEVHHVYRIASSVGPSVFGACACLAWRVVRLVLVTWRSCPVSTVPRPGSACARPDLPRLVHVFDGLHVLAMERWSLWRSIQEFGSEPGTVLNAARLGRRRFQSSALELKTASLKIMIQLFRINRLPRRKV